MPASASASTYAFDLASVSITACACRPACRKFALHRSVCRLAFLLQLCLQLIQPFDHCLRKSVGVSTSWCASLTVSPSFSASTYASDSASLSTTALACRPACRKVAVHRSVCRLAFLPKPQLESNETCRPLIAQVGHRVDKWLCIAHCVAFRFCLNIS